MRKVRMKSRRLLPIMAVAFMLAVVCGLFPPSSAQAQTFTVLYAFKGGTDGGYPDGGVILDSEGNLYGTTTFGGAGRFNCNGGCGVVFKLDNAGNETVLHSFGETKTDGANPLYGSLFRDSAGNLYGTTGYGGVYGSGTLFRLTPAGKETSVSLTGTAEGGFPEGGLTPGSAGNAYGTAFVRGSGCPPYGCGTVFGVNSAGKVSLLHAFAGGADGEEPLGGLVRDSAGNLYGTTAAGGEASYCEGCGTLFQVNSAGQETVVYSFCSQPYCADGAVPFAGLLLNGTLYGTTVGGGTYGLGALFNLNQGSGQETVLYSFCSQPNCTDGEDPEGGLVADGEGNLYGTTVGGGTYGAGTVFEVSPSGQETVLYSFTGGADGCSPTGTLVSDGAGNLYGTANGCTTEAAGTVFKIALPSHR